MVMAPLLLSGPSLFLTWFPISLVVVSFSFAICYTIIVVAFLLPSRERRQPALSIRIHLKCNFESRTHPNWPVKNTHNQFEKNDLFVYKKASAILLYIYIYK